MLLFKKQSDEIINIGITIFLIDSSGIGLYEPHISVASISKGELQYKIMALKYDTVINMDIPYIKSASTETYEEAINALKTQKDATSS